MFGWFKKQPNNTNTPIMNPIDIKKPAGFVFKFLLIGNVVGKSELVNQFVNKRFNPSGIISTGLNYERKDLEINDSKIRLIINDITGSRSYNQIKEIYIKISACIIIVYDITEQEDVNEWLQFVKQHAIKDALIILIGNKSDAVERRKVSFEEGEQFSKEHNLMFFEVSAKTGENVEMAFITPAEAILQRILVGVIEPSAKNGITINQ